MNDGWPQNKPFDDGKAAVQQRYNPLTQNDRGKADLAIATCKKALVPFLEQQEAARHAGVAPSRLFGWRRRLLEGGEAAIQADEDVVGASRLRELEKRAERARVIACEASKGGECRAATLNGCSAA